jgi:signal peptidase I
MVKSTIITQKRGTDMKQLWDWAKVIIFAVGLAFVIRTFIFAPIVVDGQSMEPNLHNGDRMIISKINYTIGEPERFDIIVFKATPEKDFIKRIIGLPGDKIEYKDSTLYVNGEKVEEAYLTDEFKEMTGEFTIEVPEERYYVLGDNRGNSEDSRIIGPIPGDRIIGEAKILFWPIKQFHIY